MPISKRSSSISNSCSDPVRMRRSTARARHAWLLRYGCVPPMTLEEIGREMGVGKQRAWQLVLKEQRRQDIQLFNKPYEFYREQPPHV
jgi:tRNA U34 5-carboxymethylaminomethyl modifying enzyme MnmG/GidA